MNYDAEKYTIMGRMRQSIIYEFISDVYQNKKNPEQGSN